MKRCDRWKPYRSLIVEIKRKAFTFFNYSCYCFSFLGKKIVFYRYQIENDF